MAIPVSVANVALTVLTFLGLGATVFDVILELSELKGLLTILALLRFHGASLGVAVELALDRLERAVVAFKLCIW